MQNDNHDKNDNLNPFSPQHPAQPQYFADRREELEDFRRMAINSSRLKIPAPVNYAIVGTWGQGKTSLLYKFRQMVIQDLQKTMRCTCIYFPLSPQSCKNWDQFTHDFLQSVKSSTSTATISQKIKSEISRWEVSFSLGVVDAKRSKQKGPPTMIDALEDLWTDYLAPSGTQVAFVLLDDLHYFPIQKEESAYLTLRTTFQELVNRGCNYSLVVTAPSLLFANIADYAEPVVRFFKRVDLAMFTFEEAKEAIEIRLKSVGSKIAISDKVVDSVVRATGGHPYLLMFVMHEMLNLTGDVGTINIEEYNRVWPRIEELLGRAIFASKFQSASPTERKLMIEIARKDLDVVSPGQFKGFKGGSRLFARLEEKELLVRRDRGRYSLFHPLFAKYLKGQ